MPFITGLRVLFHEKIYHRLSFSALIHGRHLNNFDIEMMELKRARHALFFLKSKIDSSLMQSILQ